MTAAERKALKGAEATLDHIERLATALEYLVSRWRDKNVSAIFAAARDWGLCTEEMREALMEALPRNTEEIAEALAQKIEEKRGK
jgi:hypothetical protein